MKKNTKIFIIELILYLALLPTISAQIEYKLDSIQEFQYDAILDFQLIQRTHYTYDNDGTKPTEYLYLKKELGSWLNDHRYNVTYNSDNNFLTENYQEWDETSMLWLDITRGDYEYDEFQNNTVLTYYSYDGTNWNFANRITKEFNANNQITYLLWEIVYPETTEIFQVQEFYTYDENGNNTLMEQQNWNSTSGEWENSQKFVMTYNGNLIIQQDSFIWTGGPNWPATPQSRQIYSYTNSDIYNVVQQFDSGSGLINSSIIYYTFNSGRPLEVEFKSWVNGAWKENSKFTFNYDGNGNTHEFYRYNWDDGLSTYIFNLKSLYFWSEAQPFVLGTSSHESLLAKMYPNPFKGELNISLKSALESEGLLQMFDLQGKEISKIEIRQGVKSIKLNYPHLSKGVYFLHFNTAKTKQTFKIIKQ